MNNNYLEKLYKERKELEKEIKSFYKPIIIPVQEYDEWYSEFITKSNELIDRHLINHILIHVIEQTSI